MSTTAWKGSLNLGLLSIPVKLYCASRASRSSMNNLHKPCNSRIAMPKSCPTCNRAVTPDELVKGYEYAKGKYVIVEESEIEAIAPVSNHIMEIEATVKLAELDPIYFGDSYYCAPDPPGESLHAAGAGAPQGQAGGPGVAEPQPAGTGDGHPALREGLDVPRHVLRRGGPASGGVRGHHRSRRDPARSRVGDKKCRRVAIMILAGPSERTQRRA